MTKRIRNTLTALLIAFAIAFSLAPDGGFFGISSTPSAYASGDGVKP